MNRLIIESLYTTKQSGLDKHFTNIPTYLFHVFASKKSTLNYEKRHRVYQLAIQLLTACLEQVVKYLNNVLFPVIYYIDAKCTLYYEMTSNNNNSNISLFMVLSHQDIKDQGFLCLRTVLLNVFSYILFGNLLLRYINMS